MGNPGRGLDRRFTGNELWRAGTLYPGGGKNRAKGKLIRGAPAAVMATNGGSQWGKARKEAASSQGRAPRKW